MFNENGFYVVQHGDRYANPTEVETFQDLLDDEEQVELAMLYYTENKGYSKSLYKYPHKVIHINPEKGTVCDVTKQILKNWADRLTAMHEMPDYLIMPMMDIYDIEYYDEDDEVHYDSDMFENGLRLRDVI